MENSEPKLSLRKRIDNYFKARSKIFYVYPAIPAIISFFIGLVMSILYTTNEDDYHKCSDWKDDYLRTHLFGCILIWFILPLEYMNLIFQAIKYIRSTMSGLIFYVIYILGGVAYQILGLIWLATSDCTDTNYASLSIVNVVMIFVIDAFLLFIFFWVFINCKCNCCKKNPAAVNPTKLEEEPRQVEAEEAEAEMAKNDE